MSQSRKCKATSKRSGKPCGRWAMIGLEVCAMHGGSAPQSRAKSARAKAQLRAAAEAAKFGARLEVHPADALVDLVQWTAGEVAYWREVVTGIEASGGSMTWGMSKRVEGGKDAGTTYEAGAVVAYRMLTDASNRLASYAAAALKAGVDERQVRLAERQGELVASTLRAVLGELGLTEAQWALVPEVVPRHLRALGAGTDGAS